MSDNGIATKLTTSRAMETMPGSGVNLECRVPDAPGPELTKR